MTRYENMQLIRRIVPVFVTVCTCVLALIMLVHPLSGAYMTATGAVIIGWKWKWLGEAQPYILATLVMFGWVLRRYFKTRLAFLPAAVFLGYSTRWLGYTMSGTLWVLAFCAIIAWFFAGLLHDCPQDVVKNKRRTFYFLALIFSVYFGLILVNGTYFMVYRLLGSGDVQHYLLQLKSLTSDGTLELSSKYPQITTDASPERVAYLHIVKNSMGKYYSYHSPGLPLLTWFCGLSGTFGRQILLALIAVFSVVGMFASCRELCAATGTASGLKRDGGCTLFQGLRDPSLITVATFAFSFVWVMYTPAFLPETLCCGLMAGAFWAILAQRRRPYVSTIVALICCGFLPFAHVRFSPEAGLLGAFFVFDGLFLRSSEPRAKRFLRLGFFCVGGIASAGLLLYSHLTMFAGSQAYNYGSVFFSDPAVMWGMFAEEKGLVSMLPAFAFYIMSVPVSCLMLRSREIVWRSAQAALLFTAILLGCSTSWALVGDCIPARFLMGAVVFLLPFATLVYRMSGKIGRWWFLFLAVMQIAMWFAMLPAMLANTYAYVHGTSAMGYFVGMQAFWKPFCCLLSPSGEKSVLSASFFAASLLIVSFLAPFINDTNRKQHVACLLVAIAIIVLGVRSDAHNNRIQGAYAGFLAKEHGWRWYETLKPEQTNESVTEMFNIFGIGDKPFYNVMFTIKDNTNNLSSEGKPRRIVSDWSEREIVWHDLTGSSVRNDFDGALVLRVFGEVKSGIATVCVKQGDECLLDGIENGVEIMPGKYDISFVIPTRKGRGFVYAFIGLKNNEGEIDVRGFSRVPYTQGMQTSGFALPTETTVIDLMPL